MKYTAKSIKEAKEAIKHIEALGLGVVEIEVSGCWQTKEENVALSPCVVLKDMARNHVHVNISGTYTEDVRETPESTLKVYYEEKDPEPTGDHDKGVLVDDEA